MVRWIITDCILNSLSETLILTTDAAICHAGFCFFQQRDQIPINLNFGEIVVALTVLSAMFVL